MPERPSEVRSWRFRLYVVGAAPLGLAAQRNLRRACDQRVAGDYEIDLVDLTEDPGRGEVDRVVAAPMLLRITPEPPVRVIGDLSDERALCELLDLPDAG